jgi:EAL domain-containing protein (putative c-di-GMP-specific phosphodiesterase class I)
LSCRLQLFTVATRRSLTYLKQLPLDQLKINWGFAPDILEDNNDAAFSYMVIAMASSMKLSVIAERVETKE